MIEWFWLILVTITLVWYALVIGIIALKGYHDIQEMLRELGHVDDATDADH